MTEQPLASEFSYVVAIDDVPQAGGSYSITANAEQRARVAARLGLQAVERLSAIFEVKFRGPGQVSVAGTFDAVVTQICVVSLAPVPASLHDDVSVVFISEERAARDRAKAEKAKGRRAKPDEDEIVELTDDPPEVAKGDRIDLGEVAVVHLAVALDPYPRAPEAAFDPTVWGVGEAKEAPIPAVSPFAALEKFKKSPK